MKILFINFRYTKGGAARVVSDLAEKLKSYGNEIHIIVPEQINNIQNVYSTRHNLWEKYIEFIIEIFMSHIGFQYQWFPFSSARIVSLIKKINPDIINLHVTHGMYFQTSLIKKISKLKPLVWTFHDMWPLTNNAAHTFGDNAFLNLKAGVNERRTHPEIGFNFNNYLIKKKKKIYDKSIFTAVVPSRWLFNLAVQSPLLRNKSIFHISNGVDCDKFIPMDKYISKSVLQIPKESNAVLFCAESLNPRNQFKGGDLLVEILKEINSQLNKTLHIILIGSGDNNQLESFKKLQIHNLGVIENKNLLSLCYSAADLCIYPTRAESFGLVIAESLACGTPCITYDITACPELVIPGISGFLIKPFDIVEFTRQTISALNNKHLLGSLAKTSVNHIKNNFSLEISAKNYQKLFNSLIKNTL